MRLQGRMYVFVYCTPCKCIDLLSSPIHLRSRLTADFAQSYVHYMLVCQRQLRSGISPLLALQFDLLWRWPHLILRRLRSSRCRCTSISSLSALELVVWICVVNGVGAFRSPAWRNGGMTMGARLVRHTLSSLETNPLHLSCRSPALSPSSAVILCNNVCLIALLSLTLSLHLLSHCCHCQFAVSVCDLRHGIGCIHSGTLCLLSM